MGFDVLENLLECQWRNISFPISDFSTSLEQDLVKHTWPNRDGAHVEATGRAPLTFSATLHFRNFIIPGLNETWIQPLYPTVYRDFFVAMSTRSSGQLQHPEFGLIQCKPWKAETKWLSQRRDGCDVTASWIESLDDTVSDFQDILARPSPVALAQVSSVDLDTNIGQWDNAPVTSDGSSVTFTQQVNQILGAFDTATLVSSQYAAAIDSVVYRVQSLESRVDAASDITAWPIVSSCERLIGALYDLKTQLLTTGRDIATLTLQDDSSFGALTVITGNSINDLMTLNTAYLVGPIIESGSVVRYYKAA